MILSECAHQFEGKCSLSLKPLLITRLGPKNREALYFCLLLLLKRSPLPLLGVDGLVVGAHAGLLEGLGEGGVGVARARNVLAAGAVLHGQDALGNHLASVGADDVHAQDAVRLLVGQNLDHALEVAWGGFCCAG